MPAPLSEPPSRLALMDRLGAEAFDLLIVGGGITGAATARDAVLRGLRVALVERADYASGTSSRSSNLIHGGLRYLEQYQFGMVFESVHERRMLSGIAPHLTRPLRFLFPVYEESRPGMFLLSCGMFLYDTLALARNFGWHRMPGRRKVLELEPQIRPAGLRGGALYYDAATHDALLTLGHIQDAVARGAVCLNRTTCEALDRDDSGHVTGATVRCLETGLRVTVRAHAVVFAAGPTTDPTRAALGLSDESLLRPSKGTHITVPRDRLPVRHAVVMTHPDDHRVVFAIPWEATTLIGTTDTEFHGDPTVVEATLWDVEYLLKAVHVLFPEVGLRPDEVVAAWAGLRPLVRADGATTYQTSREHEVFVDPQGIATIAGGKLTTCRMMAEELVDEALALLPPERREAAGPCRTKKVPLLAAAGLSRPKDALSLVRELARRPDVEAYLAEHLVTTFGALAPALLDGPLRDQAARAPMIPGLPYTWGEVAVQAEHGFARTTADILRRRTRVYFQAPDQGLSVCDEVARRLGAALARSEEEIAADAEAYRTEVAASRAWRAELGEPTEASSL